MLPIQAAFADNVDEEDDLLNELQIARKVLRDQSQPFSLPETQFIQIFRLNKELARSLIESLRPHLYNPQRTTGISLELKVFAALTFYASGSYQRHAGLEYLLSMSQQSVGRAIHEVTNAIYNNLAATWIKFPVAQIDKQRLKEVFMGNTGFPGCIGVVDCTHVALLKPTEEEHNYLNRKGFHSKNVEIISDYNLTILAINARYAGATHDAFIWRNSHVNHHLENCYANGDDETWLLGDSGYPQQAWLMTPFLNVADGSPEQRYNAAHRRARNCVERCIGVLKSRFRCILGERMLRYDTTFVGTLITSCAVLHNMCIQAHMPFDDNGAVLDNVPAVHYNLQDDVLHERGVQARQNIVQNYFNN